MGKRGEIVELAGQIVNGMMSADGTVLTKLVDRILHRSVASVAVGIAFEMVDEIDRLMDKNNVKNG